MRLADYVIDFLYRKGIEHAFTVCGGGSIFLCDALAKSPMRYVATHHEQGAAFAAEGYARVREGLGFCLVTSGPGGTNAVTGCAACWTDHVPVVFISGQVFSKQTINGRPGVRTVGVQEINIVDVVRPITKFAVQVLDPNEIRWLLEFAVHQAQDGRPGPVWLDIPADIQNAQIEPTLLKAYTPLRDAITIASERQDKVTLREQAAEIAKLLREAKRPLLHIGQGVRIAGGQQALSDLLGRVRIPLVTARNGNDLIASDHELYIGRPGTFAQRGANFAVQMCDLYIAVGTRLSLAQTGYDAKDYARRAKTVQVDIDWPELNKDTARIDMKVCADARDFLEELTLQAGTLAWPEWLARCKAWQEKYPPVTEDQRKTERVNSYHLVDVLSDLATPDDVIVTDMGFSFQNTHQAWKVKRGQRLMTNCGLAPMGWGLPAAIGAAVGSGRRVIAIVGDGGLMMNLQELATLAWHKLPVKLFLLNNYGYLTMRQSQAHAFDDYMGSDEESGLGFPDFAGVVRAFGFPRYLMTHSQSVVTTSGKMLREDGPAICEVMMDADQAQIPKSVNRRLEDGTIKQTPIEDAWPYLHREELVDNLTL